MLRRPWRTPGRRYAWRTVPALPAGVLATVVGALVLLVLPRRWRRRRAVTDKVLRTWARICLFVTGTRVRMEGFERLDRSIAHVVVSNHPSNLDPMVHLAVFGSSLRVLAKRELFTVPLLGHALRAAGMVEVDRGNADREAINEEVARALADGVSLLIFPEGTCSPESGMRPFKPGAFVIAVDNGAPVVPVAVEGTGRAWPAGGARIFGGTVRILAGEPLPTEGLGRQDVPGLGDRVRERVSLLLRAAADPDPEGQIPG